MPTTYQGNAGATESPSPAPGPGVLPSVSLPIDGEAASAASIAQAHRTEADFVAHIQSAVRLDVPVVNAAGSGFTTPINTGLGGSVTPSGSAHIADGTRFVIQIQTGGAVGTATFKTSMDGGNTYGALQTTAASMTDATSGITLAFSGTFTANGTAAFRSAFTPQAEWRDQGSNRRNIIDHSGYRNRGRIQELTEDWMVFPTTPTSYGSSTQVGRWLVTAASPLLLAQSTPVGSRINGPSLQITAGGSGAGQSATIISAVPMFSTQSYISAVLEWEMYLSAVGANNVDIKVGLTSSFSGTPSGSSENSVAIGKQSTDTQWQLVTGNGTAATKTPTGATPVVNTPDRFVIELHQSGSPYGTVARTFVNGSLIETTTNVPTGGSLSVAICTTTTASGSLTVFVSQMRYSHNRYLSVDAV